MKILQLNIWDGRVKGSLARFLEQNDFDVICLQEATWGECDDKLRNFSLIVDEIKEITGLEYESRSSNWRMKIFSDHEVMEQGNVILSREEIINEKIELVHGQYDKIKSAIDFCEHAYTLQIVKLSSGIYVANHHGYWKPDPIGNETTVAAMHKVAEHLKTIDGPLVMCGDLNIIDKSPAMRELDFLRDLTSENKIDNTLSGLKFDGKVACDHILVNSGVKVKEFRVLDDLVSDHKALMVDIG